MRHPLLAAVLLAAALALCGEQRAAASPSGPGHWAWPVRGEVITRYRNGDDPYAGGRHRGIDVAAPAGAPVVAAAGGVVTFAGAVGSSGRTVAVRAGGFDTSYLHLSAISVRRGQRVRAGARLGSVGTSGRRSAARPHLHFGVRAAGERHGYRDPLRFLGPLPGRPRAVRPDPAPAPASEPLRPRPAPVASPPALAARAPRARPEPRPGLGPRPWTAPAARPAPAPLAGAAAVRHAPGIDLGWLAACAGVAFAALALGRPPRSGAGVRGMRTALAVFGRRLGTRPGTGMGRG